MNCTSSKGVSGKKGTNDSIHISVIQATEKGYFLSEERKVNSEKWLFDIVFYVFGCKSKHFK